MEQIHIWAVNIGKEMPEKQYSRFFQMVCEEKKEKVKKYRIRKDAVRSMTGEVLLYGMLEDNYEVSHTEVVFGYNAHGKPYLQSHPHIHYNISHSGDWVICAVGDNPVGIDIEKIKDTRRDIARRFFTEAEYKWLTEQEAGRQAAAFCRLWTLKESYVKYMGRGLSIPLDSFSFRFDAQQVYLDRAEEKALCCGFYEGVEHYIISFCSEAEYDFNEMKMMSLEEL